MFEGQNRARKLNNVARSIFAHIRGSIGVMLRKDDVQMANCSALSPAEPRERLRKTAGERHAERIQRDRVIAGAFGGEAGDLGAIDQP